jgi:hypothetical protein
VNLTRSIIKSQPPTFNRVTEGRDAYLSALRLRAVARGKRHWKFYNNPTTVDLGHNAYAKNLDAFHAHNETEAAFLEYIYSMKDIAPRPSGYADAFHAQYHSPRVDYSMNRGLANVFAGGWQQAVEVGIFPGRFYQYDMRSAYAWAMTHALPDVTTYRSCRRPWTNSGENGVYRLSLLCTQPSAPFPFNARTEVLATPLEIETYSLPIASVRHGVRWTGWRDPQPMLDTLLSVPAWKCAARSYWGVWAQRKAVTCVTAHREWSLYNRFLNVPWAHLIVSRVRMRVWTSARRILHAFVDSIITDDASVKTGDGLGDWRLHAIFPRGVVIKGAGQYTEMGSDRFAKFTGARADDPRRSTDLTTFMTGIGYPALERIA